MPISDAFVVNTRGDAPLNANASGTSSTTQVSNFVTVQSLGTFAVASPVLKTLWELLKALVGEGWADSYWTPFVICLVYGAWQFAISVSGADRVRGFTALFSTAIIAIANAGILAASIIGLTETTGVGETS